MKNVNSLFTLLLLLSLALLLSACRPLDLPVETDAAGMDAPAATTADAPAPLSTDEQVANARSAGPAAIAEGARIMGYPEERPGNWPDEVAPELIELLPGDNGWTCIADIPDTPGNDPMCLNDTYFEVLMAQRNLTDAPATGIGFGYMLQGGGPIGSPPHMMVFVPESNGNLPNFTTEPGPQPWVMFPETTYQHLMVTTR